jgi:hypothetical protein
MNLLCKIRSHQTMADNICGAQKYSINTVSAIVSWCTANLSGCNCVFMVWKTLKCILDDFLDSLTLKLLYS